MKRKSERGLGLPEMLMAIGVFSLMIFLVNMILRGGEEQVRLAEIKLNLQEAARESLYRMGLEVRESSPSRATILNGGNTLTVQIPASVSNSGAITWSSPITYQVGGLGTQLVRIDGGTGQTSILANDIQSVNFAATGSPVQSIALTVTTRRTMLNGRVLTETAAGEARLRNT